MIAGLPGIGNVGKVANDYIIKKLKAKKIYEFFSYKFPPSVFINSRNLIEIPSIQMRYYQGKRDLLFLSGDVQPIDEESSYEFSDLVVEIAKNLGCKEIITLGGIGLPNIPEKPAVYCTGNSKKIIEKYNKNKKLNTKTYGVVGPIIGISGLLLGSAKIKKISALTLLAETYGHPMYLGIKASKEILSVLNPIMKTNIDLNEIDEEINELEEMISFLESLS